MNAMADAMKRATDGILSKKESDKSTASVKNESLGKIKNIVNHVVSFAKTFAQITVKSVRNTVLTIIAIGMIVGGVFYANPSLMNSAKSLVIEHVNVLHYQNMNISLTKSGAFGLYGDPTLSIKADGIRGFLNIKTGDIELACRITGGHRASFKTSVDVGVIDLTIPGKKWFKGHGVSGYINVIEAYDGNTLNANMAMSVRYDIMAAK